MADPNWMPDPSGAHELRYWNGTASTDHVSDQGTTAQEPLPTPHPPQPAPQPAGGKVSWKDKLKQAWANDPKAKLLGG